LGVEIKECNVIRPILSEKKNQALEPAELGNYKVEIELQTHQKTIKYLFWLKEEQFNF
jgi:hypothetical protein